MPVDAAIVAARKRVVRFHVRQFFEGQHVFFDGVRIDNADRLGQRDQHAAIVHQADAAGTVGQCPVARVRTGRMVPPQAFFADVDPVQRLALLAPQHAFAMCAAAVDRQHGGVFGRAYHSAMLPSLWRHTGLRQSGGFSFARLSISSSISTPSPGLGSAAMLPSTQ